MNERIWLDHVVYKVYRNEALVWEVSMLLPTSQVPITLSGEKTPGEIVDKVKGTYGESARRLSEQKFQEEVARRITHSSEMRALLKENVTGQDLSNWHVYASILRPMVGISIDGAIYLNGNGATYQGHQGHYEIYTYVVVQHPLDETIIERYTLVPISHP
ncbi:hypothetical protein KDA_74850 [Dictyobacter alpinus]|uniref:Uncharacterized protein n=1 Tax=Dictyobacter alpinus TaxID=2014873 RepID=A0A402BKY6_9CHLR|nr:hypothetical protein [Dictyobacter alpinus]GCE32001.1 hypothetical protein KDA_74850 [Dictyobacter alpinus]